MTPQDDIRPNEIAVDWPERVDAGLLFIGRNPDARGSPVRNVRTHGQAPTDPSAGSRSPRPGTRRSTGSRPSSGSRFSTGCTRPAAISCARARRESADQGDLHHPLAGEAQSDRDVYRDARRPRGRDLACPWARLRRPDPPSRSQTRTVAVPLPRLLRGHGGETLAQTSRAEVRFEAGARAIP